MHANGFVSRAAGKQSKADPKHSHFYTTVCHKRLILATCCDSLQISILFFVCDPYPLWTASLYTEGQHVKVMKHAIFNCMLVGYYSFCSGPDGSEEGGWAALLYGKIQTRNLSSCSSSLFVSLCVYSSIFFLRKHNNSQLTWSQGEHDHGNHAGDQSEWRVSGKWEGFALYSKLSILNTKGRLNFSGIRFLDLCTPVGTARLHILGM